MYTVIGILTMLFTMLNYSDPAVLTPLQEFILVYFIIFLALRTLFSQIVSQQGVYLEINMAGCIQGKFMFV